MEAVRGKLLPGGAGPSFVELSSGKRIQLAGDRETLKVLADPRLKGVELEAHGRFTDSGRFEVGHIHARNLFVIQDGKKLMISYWCDVCSIRTYSPGTCMCCQEETALDLRESIEP